MQLGWGAPEVKAWGENHLWIKNCKVLNLSGLSEPRIKRMSVIAETGERQDKGIDPQTGKAIWGALMGSYRYIKRQDFAAELPV